MVTAVARILDDLRQRGGLQGKDITNIVGASPPTGSRWSRGAGGPLTAHPDCDRRAALCRGPSVRLLHPDETQLWLHARHPLLNGKRAIDVINGGRTEEVLAVIERLDSGSYIKSAHGGPTSPASRSIGQNRCAAPYALCRDGVADHA